MESSHCRPDPPKVGDDSALAFAVEIQADKAESIRTALRTLDPRFASEITVIRDVSEAQFRDIAGGSYLYFRQGTTLSLNAEQFALLTPRGRTMAIRQAIGQKVWAENKALQSAFGKLFKADPSLRRLGGTSQAAFVRAFARMNGGLARQAGFVKYYENADRLIRGMTGMTKLTEQQRVFFQLMKTGRSLGADIRATTGRVTATYRNTLAQLSKKFGLRGPDVDVTKLGNLASNSRSSLLRTFNERLAKQIDSVSKEMFRRGEAITSAQLKKYVNDFATREYARQQMIAGRYEEAWARTEATMDFVRANDLDGKVWYYVVPDSMAICDICRGLIGGNPYENLPDPTPPCHKHCVHSVEVRARGG